MRRRSLFAALLAFPAALGAYLSLPKPEPPLSDEGIIDLLRRGRRIHEPRLPSGAEVLKSFDARDWAKAFVAHARRNPLIPLDEETMTTWFANALMRGYDEHAHLIARRIDDLAAGKPAMIEDSFPPQACSLIERMRETMRETGETS